MSEVWTEDVVSNALVIRQRVGGYRFGLDALLLATDVPEPGAGALVYELGAGQGAVCLSIAARWPEVRVVGVERHSGLLASLEHNIERNGSRAVAVRGDVREPLKWGSERAALVVCNPPFFDPTRRRPSADEERACARYELHGGLGDFVGAAHAVLEERGVFKVVLPPERLVEFSALVSARGMGVERLRFVHDRDGVPAYLFEAWCRKGGRAELEVSPPLVVRGADGRYCEEVARRVAGAAAREPSRALIERVKEVVR